MKYTNNISINDFDYLLPEERIAKYPLEKRDDSKLLIFNKGKISHKYFPQVIEYIYNGSVLVFNNTKVIHARLKFKKPTGAKIEIFILEPTQPSDYQVSFAQTNTVTWKCFIGNNRKWKNGSLVLDLKINNKPLQLKADKVKAVDNAWIIQFNWNNPSIAFSQILEQAGNIPIPPYLNRESEESDTERYQTVYSREKGSVAAPTAGLHFTSDILKKIQAKGCMPLEVTLHVGAGTFKPVTTNNAIEHEMHAEYFVVTKETITNLLQAQKRIVVGTTSVRTLESLYWIGVKILNNGSPEILSQWDHKSLPQNIDIDTSFNAILNYLDTNNLDSISTHTQIMITPGYQFRVVDIMVTNFHQPKSTLLLLVSAFIGEKWEEMYQYALDNDFRFLSYGDSSILIP